MKIWYRKIHPNKIPAALAVAILSVFAFSQLSWGNLIPSIIWHVILVFAIGLLFLDWLTRIKQYQFDLYLVTSVLMLFICYIWNNQDIARYGWTIEIYNTTIFLFYWLGRSTNKWFKYAIVAMIGAGSFFTLWTFICYFNKNIYYNFVYPLMQTMGYISDYKAGFTASYGTNGLYMSMGLCAFIGYLVFNGKKGKSVKIYVILFILVIGMLLCGKRGQSIALIIAYYVLYYFYNSNRKMGRIFKLFSITLLIFLLIYLVSLFIPDVLVVISRFIEQSNKDDISTGRFSMWETAWMIFKQNPLFGMGWRWFRYSAYTLNDYDVHNVFLQWLTELGIIGSIPFYIFVFANIVRVIKLMFLCRKNLCFVETNEIRYISVALMYEIFFIVMCATGTAYYQFECLFPYMVCCGIVHYYSMKYQNEYKKISN